MSEHQEQVAVVQWFDWQYPRWRGRLVAIPNGGNRQKAVAGKLKAEGVRAGFPDMFLPVARHGFLGLMIELKAQGGSLRQSQRDWLEFLSGQGYMAVCCVGAESAMETIQGYLDERQRTAPARM